MNKCKICQKLVDGFVLMQYFNRNKTHKWKWPRRGGEGESEIFLRFYGNNFEVSVVRANIFWGFMEMKLRLQEGGRILFEVGRSSVPIRDFSMEFPLHIWKGTPWQFQNTEIEKEDLISWLYALYSQTALRTQTTKYSTVHFVFGPLIQNEKASDM